jgi:hypothetical protein
VPVVSVFLRRKKIRREDHVLENNKNGPTVFRRVDAVVEDVIFRGIDRYVT